MTLPGEARVRYTKSNDAPKPKASVEVSNTQPHQVSAETGGDVSMKDTGAEHGVEQKRPPSESPVKPKPKKAKNMVAGDFNELSNEGNGDGLFLAISQSLAQSKAAKDKKTPLQCRAMAVSHLRRYKDAYQGKWDGCYPKQGEHLVPDRNFAAYLEALAIPKAWGSALECTALSLTLDRPIYVVCPDDDLTYVFNPDGKKRAIYLKFVSEHYTCLVPKAGTEPPQFQNVVEGSHSGLRGAADSGGCTRTSVRRRLQQESAMQSAEKEGMDESFVRDSWQWQCNLCAANVTADTSKKLSKNRWNHIRQCHRHEVPKGIGTARACGPPHQREKRAGTPPGAPDAEKDT